MAFYEDMIEHYDVRGSPFPGRIHPTVSVTGMPSAL